MDRKVLELMARVTPELLYTDDHSTSCRASTRQAVNPAWMDKDVTEKPGRIYSWACTRPKGHSGPHVACYGAVIPMLCPVSPWYDGEVDG